MSDINISVEEIKSIHDHPNADRLEIAKILGTQVVVQKGGFVVGDKVVYFPPDMMIPLNVSERLGVQKYLKFSKWDDEKIPCRIAACRMRGIPSYGFVAERLLGEEFLIGKDVTELYGGRQYEPPVKVTAGDAEGDHPDFPRYTNIQHFWRNPDAIVDGTMVRITEKLHGTNSRVGLVKINDAWTFVAGSHNLRIKPPLTGDFSHSRYWQPLLNDNLRAMIQTLSIGIPENVPVVVYGEIFGPGIQDMDYGLAEPGFRVFDIMVDGEYLNWYMVEDACLAHHVPTVPLLYTGPFSWGLVEKYTCGPSIFGKVKSKFTGREGIVITPLEETWSPKLQGRTILKSVSADYLDRKGAQDNE
jgi:RNA ligase (TIGR02306 family)